jgi:hypothetical protein
VGRSAFGLETRYECLLAVQSERSAIPL